MQVNTIYLFDNRDQGKVILDISEIQALLQDGEYTCVHLKHKDGPLRININIDEIYNVWILNCNKRLSIA